MAIVDSSGVSLVPTFAWARDAMFNVAEALPASYRDGVSVVGNTVTVGLGGVPAGLTAKPVFRLVNNDGDQHQQ